MADAAHRFRTISRAAVAVTCAWVALAPLTGVAQERANGRQSARALAPVDLTGFWVAIVTEDWRWRMITPPKGDYSSVPLTEEGRRAADQWDPGRDIAAGQQCRAYGAAGIMRMPTRLRISWQDDVTLKIETDAGRQTRLLRFIPEDRPRGARTRQGHSVAAWEGSRVIRRAPQPEEARLGRLSDGTDESAGQLEWGTLKVVTSHMLPGYLRRNGVPYSEQAVVTEYFDRHGGPGGAEWFTVTTVVEDPRYLTDPFVTSSHFRRELDGSRWNPRPCEVDPPLS